MKSNFKVFVVSSFLVFFVSIFVFQFANGGFVFTGFVVGSSVPVIGYVSPIEDNFLLGDEKIVEVLSNVSLEDVMLAFEEVDDIILQMRANNFSVVYVEDSLIEMKRIFEQVNYAEVLRDDNVSYEGKSDARSALRLIDWEDLDYSEVMVYYYDIVARRDLAFLLWDKIIVEEPPPGSVSLGNVEILREAKTSFYAEMFSETEELIKLYRVSVEDDRAERTVFAGVQRGAKNLFERYWVFILIGLVLTTWIIFFFYKKIKRSLLKGKISKMEMEVSVLKGLVKKAQIARFKKGELSKLVYNIRMKKYNERLGQINQELPVLKTRLKGKK